MSRNESTPEVPTLWLTPYFVAKYAWFRDRGKTEVSGYGLSDPDNLLHYTDLIIPKQQCSGANTEIDEDDWLRIIATELMDKYPAQCYHRLWAHTHPGFGPQPSSVDESTFVSHMQSPTWGIMLIYSTNGDFYARFCQKNPRLILEMEVGIDWAPPHRSFDPELWEKEYLTQISESKAVGSRVFQGNDNYWKNRDGELEGGNSGFATRKKHLESGRRSGSPAVADRGAEDLEYLESLTRERTANDPLLSYDGQFEFEYISELSVDEFSEEYGCVLPREVEEVRRYLPDHIQAAAK